MAELTFKPSQPSTWTNAVHCYGTLSLVWLKGSYFTQLSMIFQNDFLDLVDNKSILIYKISATSGLKDLVRIQCF